MPKRQRSESTDSRSSSSSKKKGKGGEKKKEKVDNPWTEKTFSFVVSLLPHALANIRQAVREKIDGRLLKYDRKFGGVPVLFTALQITERSGQVLADEPHVHVSTRATAHVFAPKPGMTLTGKVQKVAATYVSILVKKIFNATCKLDPAGGHDTDALKAGAKVRFIVVAVVFSEGLLNITGTLLQ